MNAYEKLAAVFDKQYRIEHAVAMLSWDEAVMMPVSGADARASSVATLKGLAHDLLTGSDFKTVLADTEALSLADWQTKNLSLMAQRIAQASAFSVEFVEKYSQACMACEQGWRRYRAENNWLDFKPLLATVIELTKEKAQRLSQLKQLSSYDALIDEYSPGVTQAMIDPLFSQLQSFLPNKIDKIIQAQNTPKAFEGSFAVDKQQLLAKDLMSLLGFDFEAGRLDISHHPFCGGVPEDIRITTRYEEASFLSSVMGVCHETGHALYEAGLPKEYSGQPVGNSYGMSVHESQSLFLEMQICRSKPFMALLNSRLEKFFASQNAFEIDNLYQHYIRVEKGLIRVDADEVTYPLHIIMRYQLEKQLIAGDCQVDDLPELWDQAMTKNFDLSTKGNDKDGVMQDVHWPCGALGYFPAYTLGALIAAQLAQTMYQAMPTAKTQLDADVLKNITLWLRDNIHQWGSFHDIDALLTNATGRPLEAQPFIEHIEERYGT